MQFWSQSLDLAELKRIAEVTLTTFEAFPSAIPAIAQVAFAGFQVAHESILQFDAVSDLSLIAPADLGSSPQPSLWPSERALEILNTEKHLVGLVRQTIFCIATDSIEEIVLYETHQLQNNNGHEYILWRDRSLLLHQLTDLWPPSSPSVLLSTAPKSSAMILILTHEAQPLALALDVDRLIVEPALKLNRPDNTFTPQRCCYGLTTLGQDSGMAVVDVNCLLQEQLSVALLSGLSSLENHDPRRFQASLALSPKAFRPPQPNLTPAELKTILIVDDSKTVRAMLALTLQEAGYNVLQAQDGQQAIEYLQGQANIHLTICDLEMSNLNGFEFLRHRLQNQHWIQIPVLILSSHTGEEYRQLSKKLGAVDYFTIPYDRAALLQTIERLLNPNHL
jgi:chemotaxis family two-component system sensor histidine kinase/response regulator PixL